MHMPRGHTSIRGPVVVIFATLLYMLFGAKFFDARDYITDRPAQGPFAAGSVKVPDVKTAKQITFIKAGQSFSWISTLCLASGASATAHVMMVPFAHKDDLTTASVEKTLVVPSSDNRCGPRVGNMVVPVGTPAGHYQIERTITIDRAWFPLTEHSNLFEIDVR